MGENEEENEVEKERNVCRINKKGPFLGKKMYFATKKCISRHYTCLMRRQKDIIAVIYDG